MSKEGPGPTHYSPEKISCCEKERSILNSNHLDQSGINWTMAYDPFLIVYYSLFLEGLTKQFLAQ